MVSPTVFEELDYRKRFPEHQENAQLAIKHINAYRIPMLGSVAGGHGIKNDTKIIQESKLCDSGLQVVVVSDDEGMKQRAKVERVDCINLSEFQSKMLSRSDVPQPDDLRLFKLVLQGDWSSAKEMASTYRGNPNFIGADNLTPLIHFVRKKSFEAVKFWVALPGCDLNKYDSGKFPMAPFAHAAQRGWLMGVQFLLDSGANPHLLSRGKNKGNSALLIAVWDGRLDIVRYLLENKSLKISINQADGNGFTPLIKAAIRGRVEIARYLLSHPDLDRLIRDRDGKSVSDYLKENGHREIIELLDGHS